MLTFAVDYFLLVFISGICTIQIACTFSGLTGLLYMKSAPATRSLVERGVGFRRPTRECRIVAEHRHHQERRLEPGKRANDVGHRHGAFLTCAR
ncbi:MAG: hypothetical protein IIC21_08925 [Chloroflexi bacterium]|nr:hypothetical protein [Chloroflexota bacterium]